MRMAALIYPLGQVRGVFVVFLIQKLCCNLRNKIVVFKVFQKCVFGYFEMRLNWK